ncbi:MAG: IS6 family transposase, partial [Thermoprotei archaeon]
KFKDPILNESAGSKIGLMVIALDLHFKGLSIRQIKDHLWQVYGEDYSQSTVHRWITKLIQKFNEALSREKIEVGDKWLADETIVKVNGKAKYLWNIMDYETRHHIVSMLSDGRSSEEALKAIKEAIARAGKPPKKLVTDGLKSYSKALEHLKNLSIQHISNVGIAKKENNNRIERLHGTIKEWARRKRHLKNIESTIELLEAFRLYYNYIRPNQALLKQQRPRRKLVSIFVK